MIGSPQAPRARGTEAAAESLDTGDADAREFDGVTVEHHHAGVG